jgi:hypothetical protein
MMGLQGLDRAHGGRAHLSVLVGKEAGGQDK